ncbi:MAG: inositol monophosphatase [Elusimicrobia bacterium CG08_land_8_20_14_0_20_44_26]|nr:MAG: inositol monophosphatase [Elusimicrobia bacterium CG08_land_8_20_14_0_20_44_26]
MRKKIRIRYKGKINPVTNADKKTERYLIKKLSELGVFGFLCEENTYKNIKKDMWVIDPIDGTVNYTHGLNKWAVSISLVTNGKTELAVTYNPSDNEMFSALSGKGAFLNGRRIRVSNIRTTVKALLATGFPYYVWEKPERTIKLFRKFLSSAQGIRRYGSATIDMAYVACGRFDGFWEEGLYPWDISAGKLLIEEAGGKVTDYRGGKIETGEGYFTADRSTDRPVDRTLLSSNGLLHRKMLDIINCERKRK